MNLHWIDWSITVGVVAFLAVMACVCKKYTRSVADFLAANRCAGRYMLTMSEGMAGLGAITVVANFERFYNAGFASSWWDSMLIPIGLMVTLSGWIIYRYRETRAMTIGQFYEMRYSRKFRIFAGILAWVSGIVNYGIFPAVTARFFIYFCGIPQYFVSVGSMDVNVTMGLVMFVMLSIAISFTFLGGQVAVMVTDFFQGQLLNIVFLIVAVILFFKFGWSNIIDTLKQAPEGQSMLNPFDQADVPDFKFSFFLMQGFLVIYSVMAWQGNQGYNCSARTPHEARMSRILQAWRVMLTTLIVVMIPICAMVLLRGSLFPEKAAAVQSVLETIKDDQIRGQMTVPISLTKILPVGVMGLFCAVMAGAAISTDDTYLHSWGSIFIQDVVLPIRKKKLTPEQHMKWLRMSILGVAVFAWLFSMLFPIGDYIFMFFAITGAIYVGGAGAVIVGGLYWKRSTTAGAWSGMITGSTLAVSSLVVKNILWPHVLPKLKLAYEQVGWLVELPEKFPLDGLEMSFYSSLIAVVVFVVVSLLTKPDPDFDMDKLLHRGKYAVETDHEEKEQAKPARGLKALVGITKEFTLGDKIIYFASMGIMVFWFVSFVIGTVYGLFWETTDEMWSKWWLFRMSLTFILGCCGVVWFLWGGFKDLFDLFASLKKFSRDSSDDGTVEESETAGALDENKQEQTTVVS